MTESIDTARDVLERLVEGNHRFAAGTANRFAAEEMAHRKELAGGQAPEAVVLTCSDSRVPPTLVFDQGLGDIFEVRVAGNVVTPEQLGSVEFAVDALGARLVLVLGHTGCGAVTATLDALMRPEARRSPNLQAIVRLIRPAVTAALEKVAGAAALDEPSALTEEQRVQVVEHAVRLNVATAVRALREGSELLDGLVRSDGLTIVGGEYCLETGTVEIFD